MKKLENFIAGLLQTMSLWQLSISLCTKTKSFSESRRRLMYIEDEKMNELQHLNALRRKKKRSTRVFQNSSSSNFETNCRCIYDDGANNALVRTE
jgi:hypothetical protein